MSKAKVVFVEIPLTQGQLEELEGAWELYDAEAIGIAILELNASGYHLVQSEYKGQPQAAAYKVKKNERGEKLATSAAGPTDAAALVALQMKVIRTAGGFLENYKAQNENEQPTFG